MTRLPSRMPLAAWTALLGVGTVSASLLVTLAVQPRAWPAAALGASAGLTVSALGAWAAAGIARAVNGLRQEAALRLQEPDAPLALRERGLLSTELSQLAQGLDALHHRVRVADELAERAAREAQTAAAGVFELLSGLVAAEEGARGQLAAELHDTAAQSLMIARGMLAARCDATADIAAVTDYIEDAEEQVRAVMARTRPPALREGDLAGAVNLLRADMLARYALTVHAQWPDEPYPLPLSAATTVYRFFQEALLNVVKHADVDEARLSLEVLAGHVQATVRDDGPGFDPAAVRPDRGRHVGLGLLRERARLSGGCLTVDSRPGHGATLQLRLPRPVGLPTPQTSPASGAQGTVPHPAGQRRVDA